MQQQRKEKKRKEIKAILALHIYHNPDIIIFIFQSSKNENCERAKQITEPVARNCSCKQACWHLGSESEQFLRTASP